LRDIVILEKEIRISIMIAMNFGRWPPAAWCKEVEMALPKFEEEQHLVKFEDEGRSFRLNVKALEAWKKMKEAAKMEGFPPLEEEFEKSVAFQWLSVNAKDFGFRLSYPKENRFGIAYEPWHWFYEENAQKDASANPAS